MNRSLAMIAVCMLLLAGCSAQKAEESTPQTTQQAAEQLPSAGAGQAVVPEEGDISIDIG